MPGAAPCCSWTAMASIRRIWSKNWSATGSRTATTSSTRPRRIAPMNRSCGGFRLLSPPRRRGTGALPGGNPFLKGLASWIGFRQIRVDYEPAAREHGMTTFSAGRLVGLSIEGLPSFSVAPLRFASLLGVLLASAAFLFGLSILWETMIDGKSVPGYPSLVVGLMTIGGVQLIMIGIVGEYIGKILSELKARPIYFVAEHSEKHCEADGAAQPSERTAAE